MSRKKPEVNISVYPDDAESWRRENTAVAMKRKKDLKYTSPFS